MASILKKAQQKKDQSKTKVVTNLNILNQQEVIEDKIIAPSSSNQKRNEEDTEEIDLSNVKPIEKTIEETKAIQSNTMQQNIENTTWVDTKEMDDQEAFNIAASQVQPEKEDPNKGKKLMRSWVPQMREDGESAVATFNEEASYFPEMDAEILTKKVEKKTVTSTISRSDDHSYSSSSNPPRFQNSNKGGFKQLELTEQQKKLLEFDEKNKKEYKAPGAPGYQNFPESNEGFMPNNSTQPPRFVNKKANEGGNFVTLQKSELDMKQEEAQKRAEERLKELKTITPANTEITQQVQETVSNGDEMRRAPRFVSSKPNPEDEKKAEGIEEFGKPQPKFVNTNKASQGPNFKPLETKEVKLPEVLENKKYLVKKAENDNSNKKENTERKQRNDKQEQSDDQDSEPEYDENGFKIVGDDKRSNKQRSYKNGGSKNNKQRSDKKKEGDTEEQTQEIQA